MGSSVADESVQRAQGWRSWTVYVLALLLPVLTVCVSTLIHFAFGERPLLILFMLPIIVVSMLGGVGPGLLATVVTAGIVDYFQIPPAGSFEISSWPDAVQWVTLIANGIIVSLMSEGLLRAQRRVTERWRNLEAARNALALNEARYKALFENSSDGIALADAQTGTIIECNEPLCRMLGRSKEELTGKHQSILHPPDKLVNGHSATFKAHREGRLEGIQKDYLMAKDGRIIPVAIRGNAITLDGRSCLLGVFRDVTREQALEAQLRQAQKLEALGTLAGGIAHDLNNILSPILMGAQMLQGEELAPEQRRIAEMMVSSAERGAEIIRQILAFAHRREGSTGTVQTAHIVREVLGMIRETFPRTIRVEQHVPSDLWPVTGDATQLHLVLMNLCVNARDAMPEGGTLTIKAENRTLDDYAAQAAALPSGGEYVVWTVADDGEGITASNLPKIFDPFFTTKQPGKGTGLGLSTVHGIIKDHNGAVQVRTTIGEGTTFEVYLPAPHRRDTIDSEPVVMPACPHGGQVLVVDDEECIRTLLADFLQESGYEVLLGRNGQEGVALFKENAQSLKAVVMDMMMPELGGDAAIQAIRSLDPRIPILAMTGMTEGLPRMDDSKTHLLGKPFGKTQLLAALGKLLAQNSPDAQR